MSESKSDALDQLGEEGIKFLATREGLEPPTPGFGDQYSAN